MMKLPIRLMALALVFAVSPLSSGGVGPPGVPESEILKTLPPLQFAVDGRLRKKFDFWIQIYSRFDSQQGLIHDAKYIDHVYEVLNFSGSRGKNSRIVKEAKKKWKQVLLSLHQKQSHPDTFKLENLTGDEKKVFDLLSDVNEPNKFLNAMHRKRIRFQLGQKDRFLDGLYQSGRFLPMMEEIFKKEGMPVELTRLPFVESSFNFRARSKVGASGIWQFMRSTAKLFIQMNEAIDERNDPIRATEAAAKLLKLNFESLGSWPLAVTAYNHGRKGMMRAVRKVGSEGLEDLISEYRSRSFGFASTNFFTELLAVIELEKNAEKYFGKVERAQSIQFIEAKVPDYIDIRELSKRLKISQNLLKDLNPGLNESIFRGFLLIPAEYPLRIPSSPTMDREVTLRQFWEEYAQIPTPLKLKAQRELKYGTGIKLEKRRFKNRTS